MYITFKSDLSDFEEILNTLLTNKIKYDGVIDKAFSVVHKEHTWGKRVQVLLNSIHQVLD